MNEPAFPCHGSMGEVTNDGMTLRDYFAAQALQGFSSTLTGAHEPVFEALARDAYRMADAMLKAREA